MTELEKEAEEYISYRPTEGAKDFVVYKVKVGENVFAYVVEHKNELCSSDWVKMYEGTEQECYRVVGYLDSAEPREKQIKIDAEQIRALQKQNGELTDELTKKSDTNHQLIEQMAELNEKCSELEAQIEKMKKYIKTCWVEENLNDYSSYITNSSDEFRDLVKELNEEIRNGR